MDARVTCLHIAVMKRNQIEAICVKNVTLSPHCHYYVLICNIDIRVVCVNFFSFIKAVLE